VKLAPVMAGIRDYWDKRWDHFRGQRQSQMNSLSNRCQVLQLFILSKSLIKSNMGLSFRK
jgi:hypothetical protein